MIIIFNFKNTDVLVSRHALHCIVGLFFFFIMSIQARGQKISFDHLSVEQGLSQHSVLCIAQDSRGFMWLGTEAGLNRYDGARFRQYKYDYQDSTSLPGNTINALFNDSQQNLWVGTSYGLGIYNSKKDAFERIRINGSYTETIHCIYEDRKSRIWIGSHNGLHLLTNREKQQFQSFYASDKGIADNIVRAVFEDRNGTIWIGTATGLTKMQEQAGGSYRFETFRHESGKPNSLSSDYITGIAEDAQGKLWIGTLDDGVNLYDLVTNSFTLYSHQDNDPSSLANNHIITVLFIKEKVWVGTDEGLSIIDPVTQNITTYRHDPSNKKSLSHNSIYSLFEDANGSLWVGTYFGGANISSPAPFRIFQNDKNRSSLSNNVVTGMAEDEQHNLWIGTDGGGLNYWNRATGRFTVYNNKLNAPASLGSNRVKAVYIDKEGNIWAGTHGGGLCVLDKKANQFKRHLYGEVDRVATIRQFTSVMEDEAGRFWVAGNGELRVFRKKGTELQPLDLGKEVPSLPKETYATALFKDTAGNIWIIGGLFSGLYKISGNTVMPIDAPTNVNCIAEDRDGNIWAGLYYGGLSKYDDTTGKLIRYGGKEGFSNLNVIGLLSDGLGDLWLSTNNGLVKFTPTQNHFQTYTTSDGLAGNEFNYNAYLKDSKGELFFGGFNGISSFFPDHIKTNKYIAPIVFTGLKLFNSNVAINDKSQLLKENISVTKELVFKHNQNVFTIEFALLNFIRADKNKYAYKLDGVHEEWIEISTPSVTFTDLQAGSYSLLVKGANNDGVWGNPVAMKIVVLPPFWKTGWAYLLAALLTAAVIFFIVRFFYLRALLKRDAELHEIKLNFFTNISHEIRTHLTLMMAPIEMMQKENTGNSVLTHHLKNAQNNANRLLKLVSELMDFRKAETNHMKLHMAKHDLIDFLNDIYVSFEEISLKRNIKLSFVHNLSNADLFFDKVQMEKVIFNLLTNAFKFTHEGGTVTLHAEEKNNQVKIHITDNGKGIAPEYLDKLFTNYFQVNDASTQNTGYGIGLAFSKTIVELHKGTLTVESNPATEIQENTTRFTVTILKGIDHFEGSEWLQENVNDEENLIFKKEQAALPPAIAINSETERKQYHVLITEDNDDVRNLIKDTLPFCRFTECTDGLQGLQSALEQIPDLVISDVMMPEMDGFELCRKLKTDERTSHIPAILLTARSSQNDQVSGLGTGADIYITKPFSTQVLELSVKNLLTAREKMRQKFSKEFVLAPQNIIINDIEEKFLSKMVKVIEESMDNPEFGVDLLAKKMAMSQSVLYKKVKALTDMPVNDFAKTIRLKKAAQLLEQRFAVLDVSVKTGFSDRKYFSKEFKKQFGKTPSEFIQSVDVNEENPDEH